MTLPAVDTWDVRGVKGPAYKVGPNCSNPHCRRLAEHAHHIIRRSAIGGDYAWVEIQGELYANLTGLCPECHDEITGLGGGHKAAIRLTDGLFVWCLLSSIDGVIEYLPVAPIVPQPPTPEALQEDSNTDLDSCPTCGQVKRRRKEAGTPRRRRKTWLVKVPDEHDENGAEVLDSLVDNLVPLVPNSDSSSSGRYYVLVPVLAYALMDSERFVTTMKGVGG